MEKDLDDKLYNDYLNGNIEAFNLLYKKYKKKIEYFIFNIVHDYQKSEDLAQETFIYVMQNKMNENYSFKYYIYLKSKCNALNYINVENRRNEISNIYIEHNNEQIEKDILEDIIADEGKKELIESIALLEKKYRDAIYLTIIEGVSYKETSKILEESISNTQQLVHRGKIKLRNILIKKGFDEMNKVAKVLIIMIIATTFIGGIVYAVSNINISGKPVFEWFNVNFSDEYENYREEVHGETIQGPNGSSIELISTVCDEEMVILEFDIKLSAEDKKHLKIGEPILTEEYINATDDEDSKRIDYEYDEETHRAIEKPLKEVVLKRYGDKKIDDSIMVNYNLKPGYDEESPYLTRVINCFNCFAIIDGEYTWIELNPQSIKQISEYEYKLYQMYFLTDKELGDKTEFTLTIKDWVITTRERQYRDFDTYLKIDGQFDIELSKEKALENSKKIEVSCDEVIYEDKDLTQKIESVVVTPLQTIVKVHSTYENVDDSQLTNASSENHIGFRQYKVLSENGEEINSYKSETKRFITYADGKKEEWGSGQIDATRTSFENATLETIDYIFIENHENNSKIKIVSQEGNGIKNIEYTDIGSFEIDLTKEIK